MLFKRHTEVEDVQAGSVYCRVHRDSIVETARVVSVEQDGLGIPHVRFNIFFERPDRKFLEDARVLALESFTAQYHRA